LLNTLINRAIIKTGGFPAHATYKSDSFHSLNFPLVAGLKNLSIQLTS
jgi:hypothetical protein